MEYNYTIRTGSYPQIHHNRTLIVPDGEITCTEFIDANGNFNEKGSVVIYQKHNDKIEVVTAIWADKRRLRRYGFF